MIDRIDKKILELLQTNSQISNQDLAEQVALSPSPCSRRVKQLEDQGYIQQYVALLSAEKLGLGLTVMVSVALNNHEPKTMRNFEEKVAQMPEIIQCYLIAGQAADYLLKVVAPDLQYYQQFLMQELSLVKGVSSVQSSFVLKPIVDKTALPLEHLRSKTI